MNASRNWTCPFCNRPQTITDHQLAVQKTYLPLKEHKFGARSIGTLTIAHACANPECKEVALLVQFGRGDGAWDGFKLNDPLETYNLRPQSAAKPQPDIIPVPIREDYYEACRIRDLSPKASATLARRCLQGMIRDFCGVSKPTLAGEIKVLREQLDSHTAAKGVTHESIDAIDVVRKLGNIGAHMEKDVNLIVEIDPGEAQVLIELIEILFEEWYVERAKRAKRLAELMVLSSQKEAELEQAKLSMSSAQTQQGE
ncbi:DUF4145 domain-containing protein [Bradyrhizobium sp. LA6.12]|uniref:DUF4145 domain-containing protein n=1 Tax=unclassified Bradyrhizobium TaxID=2631580 RepID=UPI00339AB639